MKLAPYTDIKWQSSDTAVQADIVEWGILCGQVNVRTWEMW